MIQNCAGAAGSPFPAGTTAVSLIRGNHVLLGTEIHARTGRSCLHYGECIPAQSVFSGESIAFRRFSMRPVYLLDCARCRDHRFYDLSGL